MSDIPDGAAAGPWTDGFHEAEAIYQRDIDALEARVAELEAEVERKEEVLQKWMTGANRLKEKQLKAGKAIADLQAERKQLKADIKKARTQTRSAAHAHGDPLLLAEIDGLRSALEYYADPKIYEHMEEAGGVPVLMERQGRAAKALDAVTPANRAASLAGLQGRVEGQKVEIKRLTEERDAMRARAETAESDWQALEAERNRAAALREAAQQALDHVNELRDAWQRGAISEHDGRGAARSNRNVDVAVALRKALATDPARGPGDDAIVLHLTRGEANMAEYALDDYLHDPEPELGEGDLQLIRAVGAKLRALAGPAEGSA